MTRRLLSSLLMTVIRVIFIGIVLGFLVRQIASTPGDLDLGSWLTEPWRGVLLNRLIVSGRVLIFALPTILITGYLWGIFGARFRRLHLARLLSLPFSAFACVPGFWFVILVAAYSYFHWQRPGFADELTLESGPNLLVWWHAAVVALPAAAAGVAWQIRAVATHLERTMGRPWVRSLLLEGENDDTIFYRYLLRHKAASLISLFSGGIPLVLSSLIVLEPAFHLEGIGALLTESIKTSSPSGVLISAIALVSPSILASFFSELFPASS